MAEWLLGRLRFLLLCATVWLLGMVAARGLPPSWPGGEPVVFAHSSEILPTRSRWTSQRNGPQAAEPPRGDGGWQPDLPAVFRQRTDSGFRTHEIRPGDTFWELAERYGVSLTALMTANPGVRPEALPVGGKLNIPGTATGGEGDGLSHYQVQPGDSLWLIAQRYGTTVEAIARVNNLADPDLLQPGEILRISTPGRVRVASNDSGGGQVLPALAWPLRGTISSRFGPRWGRLHEGVDIAVPYGTDIRAAATGTVKEIGWMGGLGLAVVVDHGHGVETVYAHASAILVGPGQEVAAGQVLGQVGSTGNSTGPHLHFELRINGSPSNPLAYLRR